MNSDETRNILITVDQTYVIPCGVMLCSLFENNERKTFIIHIFKQLHVDVSQIISVINKYYSTYKLYEIDSEFFHAPVTLHASVTNYYRLLVGKYISDDIKKILYLDCDIIINGKLDGLFSEDLNNKVIGAVRDCEVSSNKKKLLGLEKEGVYFNSGVMLINLDYWKKLDITGTLINFIQENPEKIEFWDQDALNAVLKNNWVQMNAKYNYQTWMVQEKYDHLKLKDIAIVHYTGKSKPWQFMDEHQLKYLYSKNLNKTVWKGLYADDWSIGNFFRKNKLMPNFYK